MTTIVLYVEKDTEEGRRAVDLMESSGLEFEVCELGKKEADERRTGVGRKIPVVFTHEGFFDGIDNVGFYARVYGIGGRQYRPETA